MKLDKDVVNASAELFARMIQQISINNQMTVDQARKEMMTMIDSETKSVIFGGLEEPRGSYEVLEEILSHGNDVDLYCIISRAISYIIQHNQGKPGDYAEDFYRGSSVVADQYIRILAASPRYKDKTVPTNSCQAKTLLESSGSLGNAIDLLVRAEKEKNGS